MELDLYKYELCIGTVPIQTGWRTPHHELETDSVYYFILLYHKDVFMALYEQVSELLFLMLGLR